MSVATVRRVVCRLGPDRPPTDAELVAALGSADREPAFAELVARYGPMVLGACRRVLSDAHDAEDAFQAAFLVLARRAGTVRPPGGVGGWLYGVAVRTAQKAKTAAARRRRREMATAQAGRRTAPASSSVENADLRAVIDAELAALPESQRAAVVLCDLHGKTRAEAAAELNRPEGTVAAWLARGRKALAARLARRGVTLPAAGLCAVATPSVVSAELASAAAATLCGRAIPAGVLALAQGVMRGLSSTSTKLAAVAVACAALLGAVASATAWHSGGEPQPGAPPVATAAPVPKPEPDVKAFLDHKGYVYSAAYTPDGKKFVSVGGGAAIVWDSETLKQLYRVDAEFAAFSGDGKSLFALVKDEFRTHDATTGKQLGTKKRQMPRPANVGRSAAFAKSATMWVEFDGVRHHLRTEITDDLYDLADQKAHNPLGSTIVPVHGRGGAFSPDGKLFAGIHAATTDYKEIACLTVWNSSTGVRAGTIFRDFNAPVRAFVWSPDGKEIAVAYADGVRVHDAATLKEVRKFDARNGTALAWSKDGKLLALATAVEVQTPDDPPPGTFGPSTVAVLLLDAQTGKELRRVEGFPDNLPVVALAFRPDGKHLLSAAGFFPDDGPASNVPKPAKDAPALRVIPIDAKAEPKDDPIPGPVAWKEVKAIALPGWMAGSVAYSSDGKRLFIGGTSGRVQAYDTATWKRLFDYQEPTDFAAVAVAPGDKSLAITFKDADRRWGVRLLNAETAKREFSLEEGGTPGVVSGPEPFAVGFFPDVPPASRKLIFGTAGQYVVKTWADPEKPTTVRSSTVAAGKLPADYYAVPLAVDPNGKRVVVIGPPDRNTGTNELLVWSVDSDEANKVLEGHKAAVVSAAWSKNGKLIVTGDASGLVIVWNAATFKEKSRVKLGGRVAAVAVTADGVGVAAGVVPSAPGQGATTNVFAWLAAVPPEKPELLSSRATQPPFHGAASLAFSPDGKQLVAGFANFTHLRLTGILIGSVQVFEVAPVAAPAPPAPEKPAPTAKGVTDVSFSPDGTKYLTVSGGKVEVFGAATGKQLYSVAGAEAARFTADGKSLVVLSDKILECDAATGKIVKSTDRPKTKGVWHRVIFAPDGKRFAVHFGTHARVYDTATGVEPVKLDKQFETAGDRRGAAAEQLVWSPDGARLAANGVLIEKDRAGMLVWDAGSGKRLEMFGLTLGEGPNAEAFSADSKFFAVGWKDRVDVWISGTTDGMRTFPPGGPVTALAYSKDGKRLAVGVRMPILNGADKPPPVIGHKTEVQLFDAETLKELKRLDGFEGVNHTAPTVLPVTALAFSPDGTKLLAGTGPSALEEMPKEAPKGELKVFDLTAPEKPEAPPAPAPAKWTDTSVLTDHGRLVNGVTVAPDGKSFAAATEGNVTCWDATTRKVLWKHKDDGPFSALAYSPDSRHVFAAGKTDVLRLDAKTGEKLKLFGDAAGVGLDNFKFKTKDHPARALAISPDGKRLAGSDGDMAWTVELEKPENHGTYTHGDRPAKDAKSLPAGVAWSADGKWLAVIHPKHTARTVPSGARPEEQWKARVWAVTAEGAFPALPGHDAPLTALAWSKDGKVIATGDEKGIVILSDAATGKELWRKKFRGRDDTDGRVNALAISPTDHTVAVAVSMGSGKMPERVALLSAEGKDVDHLIRPWPVPVWSVAWSKDGAFLVTGCEPIALIDAAGEVVVWERKR